jgi:ABC-2 type transport system permease protein
MHNLGTIISFEFLRTIRKKAFWIATLAFPILISTIFALSYFSGKSSEAAGLENQKELFSLAILDNSHLVNAKDEQALGATLVTDKEAGIALVKEGKADAFFYYPEDPSNVDVEVHAADVGLFKNSRYSNLAYALLKAGVTEDLASPERVAIIEGKVSADVTTYTDGKVTPGIERTFIPGIFLILLYLIVVLLGNQMLTSTTEEKENRVIEMLLTSVRPNTLIIGKIISLFLLGVVQIGAVLAPVLIAFLFFRDRLHLPAIDLTHLPVDATAIGVGTALFFASFAMITGILVAIGASVPTAKDAGPFFGLAVGLMFAPLYAASVIVSSPDQMIVKVFSFFPLTAPVTLLLRNALGSLSPAQSATGIVILLVSAVIALWLAVRMFQRGTFAYDKRLGVKEIFGR